MRIFSLVLIRFCFPVNAVNEYYLPILCTSGDVKLIMLGDSSSGTNSSGVLRSPKPYMPNSNCGVKISTVENSGILINAYPINLRSDCLDNLTVGDGDVNDVVCGKKYSKEFPVGNDVTVIFKSGFGYITPEKEFQLIFTSYHRDWCSPVKERGCNRHGRFSICISSSLVCDGYRQCSNGEDENGCGTIPRAFLALIIIMCILAIFLPFLLLVLFVYRRRKVPHPAIRVSAEPTRQYRIYHMQSRVIPTDQYTVYPPP